MGPPGKVPNGTHFGSFIFTEVDGKGDLVGGQGPCQRGRRQLHSDAVVQWTATMDGATMDFGYKGKEGHHRQTHGGTLVSDVSHGWFSLLPKKNGQDMSLSRAKRKTP